MTARSRGNDVHQKSEVTAQIQGTNGATIQAPRVIA